MRIIYLGPLGERLDFEVLGGFRAYFIGLRVNLTSRLLETL